MNIFKYLLKIAFLMILAGCAGDSSWQSLQKSGLKAYEAGRFTRSETRLIEASNQLLSESPLDERALPGLETLGYVYQLTNNDAALQANYQLEWDILVAAGKTETEAAANVLYKLASQAQKIGEFTLADSLYQKVLSLDRKLLGSSHPYIDLDHYKLAAVKYQAGDLIGTESYLLTVLDIRSNNFTEITQLTEVLTTCIAFYESQGLFANAEPLYRNKHIKQPGYHINRKGILYSDTYGKKDLKKISRKIKFSFYTPFSFLTMLRKCYVVGFLALSEIVSFLLVSPFLLGILPVKELYKGRLGDSLKHIFISNNK